MPTTKTLSKPTPEQRHQAILACLAKAHQLGYPQGSEEGTVTRERLVAAITRAYPWLEPPAERTVKRDINALNKRLEPQGCMILWQHGSYRWDGSTRQINGHRQSLIINQQGVMGAALLQQALVPFENTPLHALLRSLLEQIHGQLKGSEKIQLKELQQRIRLIGREVAKIPEAVWSPLFEGVRQNRKVQIKYRNRLGEVAHRTLEPYWLLERNRVWLVACRFRGKENLTTLRLDRMIEAHLLDAHFQRHAAWSLDRWLAKGFSGFGAWGASAKIALRVHAGCEPAVADHCFHPGEERETDGEGRLWIRFSSAMSMVKIAQDLSSWAFVVEVMAPAKLRQEMVRWGEKIQQAHA